jgi:hypothetical protein
VYGKEIRKKKSVNIPPFLRCLTIMSSTNIITRTLDLGCGLNPQNPFNADEVYGIDIMDDLPENIRKADVIIEPIPYPDDYFDFVSAFDFIEHVPRILYRPHRENPFVMLMNEIYRVLRCNEKSGYFLSFTPAFPHGIVFRDPTHVNIITEETFPIYFDYENRLAKSYGFNGGFRILKQEWRGPHLLSIMKKVPSHLLGKGEMPSNQVKIR